jgi:hypothetical protein
MIEHIIDILLISKLRKTKKKIVFTFSIFLFIALVLGIFLKNANQKSLPERLTKSELSEIKQAILIFKQQEGRLPKNLEEIIGDNPIKKSWIKDEWNRPYHYVILDTVSQFYLHSLGNDGVPKTEDDIYLIYNSN